MKDSGTLHFATRDHGLVRGIGTLGLTFNIINGVVGAGIFTLPAAMAAAAGAAAPGAYVVCALAMACVVVCFAEAGSRVPTSGGVYGTVEAAFGPGAGFVAGMLLAISAVFASGGIAAALADAAATVLPAAATPMGRAAFILALFGGLVWANLVGVRRTARLISGATLVKLLPLLLFVAVGAVAWLRAPMLHTELAPMPAGHGGFGRALILGLFAFCGMETPLGASGEVRHANRTLPRALFMAALFVLALYLSVQFFAQTLLGPALPGSAAPLADAIGRVSPSLRPVLLAGGVLSMVAWMVSDVLGSSRILFAFARDGLLPGFLGSVSPRHHVPRAAVLVYAGIAGCLALSGSFLELVALSAMDTAVLYAMACGAAWVLHRRGTALAGPAIRLRVLPVAALVGVVSMVLVTAQAERLELLGVGGTVVASAAAYLLLRARRAG